MEASEYPNEQWVGIDLGTTTTSLAYVKIQENGKINIKMIQNVESGKDSTPSVVFYQDINK